MLFFVPEGCQILVYDTRTSKTTDYLISEIPTNFFEGPADKLVFYTRNGELWQFSRASSLVKIGSIKMMSGWKLVNRWKPSHRIYDFNVDNVSSG